MPLTTGHLGGNCLNRRQSPQPASHITSHQAMSSHVGGRERERERQRQEGEGERGQL